MSNSLEIVLASQFRARPNTDEKIKLAAEILHAASRRFDAEIAEVLLGELTLASVEELLEHVPESANAAYLRALMLTAGNRPEAASAWECFFTFSERRDPFHILAYAQVLTRQERFVESARQLELAFAQPLSHTLFVRAEGLVTRLRETSLPWLREARIAILSTSISNLITSALKALCLRDRIHAEFYQGPYGAIEQEVLDANSGLARFRPNVVLLIPNWRDLSLPAISTDRTTVIGSVLETAKSLWAQLRERFGCHVIQHGFDFPGEEAYGYLASSLPGGRSSIIAEINARMQEEAPANVSILDTPAVQRRVREQWEDSSQWFNFRQHPSSDAVPALAEAQQCHIRAVLGLTRKVLVTDLDNTLWHGVIGEDGLDGIRIGPDTPAGEAHQRLQRYLAELKSRGILLAVCSKNNPADARLPFEKHEHMLLKLDDFAAFRANWDDKAQNLRAIAAELSLGLDSFVFLDDNPLEREWVRSQLPDVAVVELGPSVFTWTHDLDRHGHFFSLTLTEEDRMRQRQYQHAADVQRLRSDSRSLDEFLEKLQLEASTLPVSTSNLQRVAQLINKTNQFNLTTRRYTEEQVLQLASLPTDWSAAFQLRDRMGAYGLIGVILCKASANPGEWEIDSWLLSCRALGRQMELFMFDKLMQAAIQRGIKQIRGIYRTTKKNGLVSALYERLGFSKINEVGGESSYLIQVPPSHERTAKHIRDISATSVTTQAQHAMAEQAVA